MTQYLKKQGLHVDDESRHILVIPNDPPDKAAKAITDYFERTVPEITNIGRSECDYATYIQENEAAILSVIKNVMV